MLVHGIISLLSFLRFSFPNSHGKPLVLGGISHISLEYRPISRIQHRTLSSTMERDYESAISKLNSLQSNAAVIAALRKAGPSMNNLSMPEIHHFIRKMGYQHALVDIKLEDLNRLNAVHIAGTKGKGSVCAMCESILRQLKHPNGEPLRVGLFTSPHLIEVRERIRINGRPLSRDQFSKYFYECWDRLESNEHTIVDERFASKPTYFRYLTLMAIHTFLQEKVDVAIMEVGVGGAYDSTNAIPQPVVCGITSLGLDHQAVLGHTLAEIAWHKAGIAKPNVPLFTAPQSDDAMTVIKERAVEAKTNVSVVKDIREYSNQFTLGVDGAHQWVNASVAMAVCDCWSRRMLDKPLVLLDNCITDEAQHGLQVASWPGIRKGDWLLDGAHTRESMEVCIQWYRNICVKQEATTQQDHPTRILIFNCTHQREARHLMEEIIRIHREFPFSAVIFCSNVIYSATSKMRGNFTWIFQNTPLEIDDKLTQQHECADIWSAQESATTHQQAKIHVKASVEEAVQVAQSIIKQTGHGTILVTGSLHLVGNTMMILGRTVETEFP
ncbi:Mur ligase [Syncephalis plumigaleata]|nr:Mur ligase [Syncephalis plumigaleata]